LVEVSTATRSASGAVKARHMKKCVADAVGNWAPPPAAALRERAGALHLEFDQTRVQSIGGGAKKQRREPSGRLQRQNAPSGLGCASL
jgi:hypothetical protein